MAEQESSYEAAARRLEGMGGHYAEHVNLMQKSFNEPTTISDIDANLVPAGIGAAVGAPVATFRAMRPTPAATASVADIARTVAAEGTPTATAAGVTPKATGRGAGVVNWANTVTPELTALEATKAGDYKQAWQQNLKAQALAEQTKGFRPGENLLLPRGVAEEQAARQALAERKAAELAARPSAGQAIKGGLREVGDILAKSKVMPIVGGAASGYDIASAIDEYNQGDMSNAAISGLSGVGGLMMMSRNPMRIGAGALMQAPALARAGYRYFTKPKE
jgi:hypothetical protein